MKIEEIKEQGVTCICVGNYFWTRGRKNDTEITADVPRCAIDLCLRDEDVVRDILHGQWFPVNEYTAVNVSPLEGEFRVSDTPYQIYVPSCGDSCMERTREQITACALDAGRWGGWPCDVTFEYSWINVKIKERMKDNPLSEWALGFLKLMAAWNGGNKNREYFIQELAKEYWDNNELRAKIAETVKSENEAQGVWTEIAQRLFKGEKK
jgi:hypothetical protein